MTATEIIRSKTQGAFKLRETRVGYYLLPTDDPEANPDLTEADLRTFHVPPDFPRIPGDLWHRWVMLAFHYAPTNWTSLEVSVRILVSATNDSQYRLIVPRQCVSGGAVHATNFRDSVDIETGEPLEGEAYPPAGWLDAGSSHSHGRMGAFFSGVDDANELGCPGIHITVGSIDTVNMKYQMAASVTDMRLRFKLPHDKLINFEDFKDTTATFHPNCLNYVDVRPPTAEERAKIPSAQFAYSGSRTWDASRNGLAAGRGGWNGSGKRYHHGQDTRGYDGFGDYDDSFFDALPAYGSRYDKQRLIGEMGLSDLTENLIAGLEYSIHNGEQLNLSLIATQLETLSGMIEDVQQLLQLEADECARNEEELQAAASEGQLPLLPSSEMRSAEDRNWEAYSEAVAIQDEASAAASDEELILIS